MALHFLPTLRSTSTCRLIDSKLLTLNEKLPLSHTVRLKCHVCMADLFSLTLRYHLSMPSLSDALTSGSRWPAKAWNLEETTTIQTCKCHDLLPGVAVR